MAISGEGLGFLDKLHWLCFVLRFVSSLYGSGAGNFCDNGYHIQDLFFKYIITYVGDEFHNSIDIIPWKGCLVPVK
jgi:hypothetical protein